MPARSITLKENTPVFIFLHRSDANKRHSSGMCDRPGQITDNGADLLTGLLHHYVAVLMLNVFSFSLCSTAGSSFGPLIVYVHCDQHFTKCSQFGSMSNFKPFNNIM